MKEMIVSPTEVEKMKDSVMFKMKDLLDSLNLITTLLQLLLLAKFAVKKSKEMHCKLWVLFITSPASLAPTAKKISEPKNSSTKTTKHTALAATNLHSFQLALVAKKPSRDVILKLWTKTSMNNASAAQFAIKLSLMENSMKKMLIHTVSNTIMNCLDIPVLNAIKPSLMELQSLHLTNTGIEITLPAPNVTKLSPMENSSKMKASHIAKNITIKEEEPSAENAANQSMECASLLLTKNGIKLVSPAPNVAMFFQAKSCSLKARSTALTAQTLYKTSTFLFKKEKIHLIK
jgi:hypothetical protein